LDLRTFEDENNHPASFSGAKVLRDKEILTLI
jgi:hypothetical protein